MESTRRMQVLRAVVEDYIRSQQPVGSSALTRSHRLGVSSATIRNDMAELEDQGYLVQPHTSAGRIPTEKGYRYFVDRLARIVPLSAAQRRGINSWLSGSVSLEDTLRRSARLLAQITGQVAVVASPSLARSTLRRLELIILASDTLLAVVITDTGRVAQRVVSCSPMPSTADVDAAERMVNERCQSQSLTRAADRLRAIAAERPSASVSRMLLGLAEVFAVMATEEQASNLYMSGSAQLTRRHSIDVSELAPLFDALEEQVVLMKLMSALSEVTQNHGVSVAIGSETHTPGLLHASVVASGYGQATVEDRESPHAVVDRSAKRQESREPVAFVGSIGPTHMDYSTTIAAVQAVAKYLTAFIAREEGRDVA